MRKILGFFLLTLMAVTLPVFIIALNIKLNLFSADKIKSLLAQSGAYQVVAGLVRESLVESTKLNIKDGLIFEAVNESINEENIKKISEGTVDQTFLALNNPDASKEIVLNTKELERGLTDSLNQKIGTPGIISGDIIGDNFHFDISNNPAFPILSQFNNYLIYLAIIVLFLAIAVFLLPARTSAEKFGWLGSSLILSGLLLTAITAAIYFLGQPYLNRLIAEFADNDAKIKNAAWKITELILNSQLTLLVIEDSLVCLLGIFVLWLGRGLRESKIDIIPG